MAIDKDLDEIIKSLPDVSGRQYWFVRTEGGLFYNPFVESGLIAIGYGRITAEILKPHVQKDGSISPKTVGKEIKKRFPDIKKPGLVAAQLIRFVYDIKKGDIVIIPSTATSELAFGVVVDNEVFNTNFMVARQNQEYSTKTARRVIWKRFVRRRDVNPNLYSLFFSHQTISCGNAYAEFIDNALGDFYQKDGKVHLQIRVERPDGINARELFRLGADLLDISGEFLATHNMHDETGSVETRINLNSPGAMELITTSFDTAVVIGAIVVGVNGGGFTAKFGDHVVEIKTDGLITKINTFLNGHAKRKGLGAVMEDLDVKDAKDALKALEKLVE